MLALCTISRSKMPRDEQFSLAQREWAGAVRPLPRSQLVRSERLALLAQALVF